MTDIPLQKTAKTAGRGRGRPFAKGHSGNPTGRPRGSSNRVTCILAGIDTRGRVRRASTPVGGEIAIEGLADA